MKKYEIKKLDRLWGKLVKEDMNERCTICGRAQEQP